MGTQAVCWVHQGAQLKESRIHIETGFGTDLTVRHVIILRERLDTGERNFSRLFIVLAEVKFVSDQYLHDIFGGMGAKFIDPIVQLLKGFLISEVEAKNDTTDVFEVHAGDVAEALLPRRIPNVKTNELFIF